MATEEPRPAPPVPTEAVDYLRRKKVLPRVIRTGVVRNNYGMNTACSLTFRTLHPTL